MPPRLAFGEKERAALNEVLDYYQERQEDPGYQGVFEQKYCDEFAELLGGGHADAVATGTASVYLALAALDLPKASHVLVSPITDPGTIGAIIQCGLVPKLVDSMARSYNTGPDQIAARIDNQTKGLIVVHATGKAVAMTEVMAICREKEIQVVEDCSQAHGARHEGHPLGTFGHIAAFSTMFRKASITGPCGGVVFTRDEALYHRALALADRGKPRWLETFDDRDPSGYLFPALNFNSNEMACAIGRASLGRLEDTRKKRQDFLIRLQDRLEAGSRLCRPAGCNEDDSPFIFPIFVDPDKCSVDARTFGQLVLAEGISLNPSYAYLVHQWPWLGPYLADDFDCPNATVARDESFCLYINENYSDPELEDTVSAILKVENHVRR